MGTNEKNMTAGSPGKLIITFAIPLMLGNIFQQFYTMADTMIVGRVVGVEALAAVGAGDWLVWLVLGLFLEGTTLGVLTVIAACPSGAMVSILSIRYGVDDTFASRVNFLSTILCAVTLPVVTSFLL